MTIEQTIEIPAGWRIFLDLPPELPVGRAKVELTFIPLGGTQQAEARGRGKIRLIRQTIDEMLQDEDLRYLTGLLQNETTAEEIRDERLRKHYHTA